MRISDWSSDVCSFDLQDVGRRHGAGAHLAGDLSHVAQVGHVGVTMGEHGARERLDLSEPRSFEAEGLPGEAHGLDRKSGVSGKSGSVSVALGVRRVLKKKKQ